MLTLPPPLPPTHTYTHTQNILYINNIKHNILNKYK